MLCTICGHWAGNFADVLRAGHHPRCPLNPALAPREDGSCHCGAVVLCTDPGGCIFCGGWTASMLEQYRATLEPDPC